MKNATDSTTQRPTRSDAASDRRQREMPLLFQLADVNRAAVVSTAPAEPAQPAPLDTTALPGQFAASTFPLASSLFTSGQLSPWPAPPGLFETSASFSTSALLLGTSELAKDLPPQVEPSAPIATSATPSGLPAVIEAAVKAAAALNEPAEVKVEAKSELKPEAKIDSVATPAAEAKAEDEKGLRRERDALAGRVRALEDELTAMRASQELLVENLFDRSKKGVADLERVVAMTGLDIDRMIGTKGRGGPQVEAKYTEDETLNERVTDLRRRLERWQSLQSAVKNLPLVAPLGEYRVASGFGGRRDPFTGRWSSHNGIDMAVQAGTPIQATGPGTVVLTGWHGGYGWMVEVDHGMGVRTRYAHMQSILAEKGQKVEVGSKIGLVGSSGRSSGPHLHYEILIDGKAVDPTNFLTAGRYVLKR